MSGVEWGAFALEYLWLGLVIIVGTIVNVLQNVLSAKESTDIKFGFLHGFYVFLGSAFFGCIVALGLSEFVDNIAVLGAASGFAGYKGIQGLDDIYTLLVDGSKLWINNKFGSDDKDDKDDDRRRDRYNRNDYNQDEVNHTNPNTDDEFWEDVEK